MSNQCMIELVERLMANTAIGYVGTGNKKDRDKGRDRKKEKKLRSVIYMSAVILISLCGCVHGGRYERR